MNISDININDYDYDLPESRIAQYPEKERDHSKLLIWNNGIIKQSVFRDLEKHLPEDSLLVFNNSKVIRARLLFGKSTGASIEILCLEPLNPPDYESSFGSRRPVEWKCIIGNLKKWKRGPVSLAFKHDGKPCKLLAERTGEEGDAWRVRFSWEPVMLTFAEVTESAGHIPLPPYITRKDEKSDSITYQTIYSRIKGSVAAPTAGLHFTPTVLSQLKEKGIGKAEITLHVGAGTFQPVKSEKISGHAMHSEHFMVDAVTIETLLENKGRLIAVGTTSVRTIESLYWLGVKVIGNPSIMPDELLLDQWEAYSLKRSYTVKESLSALLIMMKTNNLLSLWSSTRLIILPGYRFRMITGMVTNFHQPRSTLLLLVSAFTGARWKEIYRFALDNGFRFLSYGDSSLLLGKKP